MWKYRDWVINALNQDMPFNEFTIEQLAGDMLPDATIDQKIATGFHRNTLTNREGGAKLVPGQNKRVDIMAETGLFADGKKGIQRCSDPHLRVKDMDRDGVDAEVIFGADSSLGGRKVLR